MLFSCELTFVKNDSISLLGPNLNFDYTVARKGRDVISVTLHLGVTSNVATSFPANKGVSSWQTPNSYTWGIYSLIQTLWQKDIFLIMSNCSFGYNLFLSRLLQRRQKLSLIGKGFSRNVTPFIICSSYIEKGSRQVASEKGRYICFFTIMKMID